MHRTSKVPIANNKLPAMKTLAFYVTALAAKLRQCQSTTAQDMLFEKYTFAIADEGSLYIYKGVMSGGER